MVAPGPVQKRGCIVTAMLMPKLGDIWGLLGRRTQVLIDLGSDRNCTKHVEAHVCIEYLAELYGELWTSDREIDNAIEDIERAIDAWRNWDNVVI